MKWFSKWILLVVVGNVLGMTLLAPMSATGQENVSLREEVAALEARVTHIEFRLTQACSQLGLWRPNLWKHLAIRGAC
jgi:hypothetical protein